MCGIAGIVCFKRSAADILENKMMLKKMTNCIAHRGPDGEGQVCLDEGHVFLGHRRLAVIDLSAAAAQPMQSIDKRYTISYNGEVYNYKELRRELEKKGYSFFSDSDTEVVMNAYAEWGTASFVMLNGIFAFSIWDDYRKELILVRDRYGAKPLYYSRTGNKFVFASEYKAIIVHKDFKRNVNLYALKEYFTFQNIFSNQSFLNDIHILEAGCYLKMDYSSDTSPKSVRFWDYDFHEEEKELSKEEYAEELDRLFAQAVKRQLVSDVPLGTYLSGGLDSGSITSIASKSIPYIKTFTCGFDLHSASGVELSYDEREKAEYMSYIFKTEHYEMVLKSGDMERCMDKLVWHLEDPRVGQSYPNYYAAKLSSQFVKVVLAGTGGDEIFAGYPWRYHRVSGCRNFNEYVSNYYQYWQRLLNNDEIKRVFSPIYDRVSDYDTAKIFESVFDKDRKSEITLEQSINCSLYFEAKTFLHGLLIVEDKISMAHGLETRVPFLDNDLVDFAMKMPLKYKLRDLGKAMPMNENETGPKNEKYFKRTNDGKLILRTMMEKYVPQDITTGIKQGFSAPDASWFKGESLDYVNSVVWSGNSRIYDYLDKRAVREIVNNHIEGLENRRLFIWAILNFEKWLELYL